MKTFQQFQEAAGDKFSKMTDAQFKDWQRANPGGAEKAQRLRDAARSATPKPTGSGPQLPNVQKQPTPPQGQARWNSGQRFTDPRAQQVYDTMRQQSSTRVAPRTTATPPPPTQPLSRAGAGIASRVLPALGRAAVGAVARHPVGATVVGTGLAAYGAYKLAQRMNQNTRAPKE